MQFNPTSTLSQDNIPFPLVMLVNESGETMGVAEKQDAHLKGLLHCALSVMLYRKKSSGIEVLLQKRHAGKYHSPGVWSNTCCTHPQPFREILTEAKRCLQFEVGINEDLAFLNTFTYYAKLSNGLIENEFDHLFVGMCDKEISEIPFNPTEIETMAWVNFQALVTKVKDNPQQYSAWLPHINNQLSCYFKD